MKNTLIIVTVMVISLACAGIVFAGTSANVTVNAIIAAGSNTLTVTSGATLDFGTVTPVQGASRFSAGPITVSYFAANSPWTIRAYTQNAGGKLGLIGADGASLAVKLWNGNSGGTGIPPNPNTDANWTGGSPVWGFVVDKASMSPTDPLTWKVLCATSKELSSPFDNYLGIDAAGAKAEAYTTVVTVDIVAQ